MKSIRLLFAAFLAMLMFSSAFAVETSAPNPAQAIEIVGKVAAANVPAEVVSTVATSEYFYLGGKYPSLWSVFVQKKYPRQDWPKYWKEASVLSGIPHTDLAWRNIPEGKAIFVPRSQFAIIAEEAEREVNASVAKENAVRAEIAVLQNSLADARTILEAATARIFKFSLVAILFVVFSIVFFYMFFTTRWKLDSAREKIKQLEDEYAHCREPLLDPFPTHASMNNGSSVPVGGPVAGVSSDHSGTRGDDATAPKSKCSKESCEGCPSCDEFPPPFPLSDAYSNPRSRTGVLPPKTDDSVDPR